MYLKRLSLTNFRKFARLDVDLPPRVVVLAGANAQGKTSVLEAIYFLAAFTSFQTHADRQIVNFYEAKNNQLTVTRLVAEYRALFASPYKAAEAGFLDRVIRPRETRKVLVDAFDMLKNKRQENPPRKHGNIPL